MTLSEANETHKGDLHHDRFFGGARMRKPIIARQPHPTRPDISACADYSQFTEPELIAELVWMHDQLQILWGCALHLDPID
jgi:hypothetical protein